jgi:hypothetical protein
MTVEVADTHAHVHKMFSLVKMAIVLEDYTTEEHGSVVCFLWAKGHNIHKEIFPVYGGKCLSRKSVDNWLKKFSRTFESRR